MGMDAVELILMAEEQFGIEILDSEAELLSTPGDLCALIERKLGLLQAEKLSRCPTSRAFYAVRRELINMGVERAQITPNTSLESFWPRYIRRYNWSVLGQSLDVQLPALERSPEWAFVGLLPLGILPVILYLSPLLGLSLCLLYALLWMLGTYATRPFALHPPQRARTVADLSRLLAPRFYEPGNTAQNTDVWPLVQHIVSQVGDIPIDKVQADSHFYRDLGLS